MPLQITLGPSELLDFLKMEEGFDPSTVNVMLESAKMEAETFLNTDFSTVDENGQSIPNEAPATVKEWVFNRVAQKYENIGSWVNPDFTLLQPLRVHPFRGL